MLWNLRPFGLQSNNRRQGGKLKVTESLRRDDLTRTQRCLSPDMLSGLWESRCSQSARTRFLHFAADVFIHQGLVGNGTKMNAEAQMRSEVGSNATSNNLHQVDLTPSAKCRYLPQSTSVEPLMQRERQQCRYYLVAFDGQY